MRELAHSLGTYNFCDFLFQQTLYLRENLEEERKAREHFERIFRKVMQRVTPDLDLTDDKLMSKTTPI